MEGWKAELPLKSPSGFEPGIIELGILELFSIYSLSALLTEILKLSPSTLLEAETCRNLF